MYYFCSFSVLSSTLICVLASLSNITITICGVASEGKQAQTHAYYTPWVSLLFDLLVILLLRLKSHVLIVWASGLQVPKLTTLYRHMILPINILTDSYADAHKVNVCAFAFLCICLFVLLESTLCADAHKVRSVSLLDNLFSLKLLRLFV